MKKSKFAAVFALVVGIGMIGLWTMLIITGQVEEFETIPYEIALHLAGEFLTAIILIIASLLILIKESKGNVLLNIAFGSLLYTVMVSSGYYLQRNELPMVIMFAVIFILTIVSLFLLNKKIAK